MRRLSGIFSSPPQGCGPICSCCAPRGHVIKHQSFKCPDRKLRTKDGRTISPQGSSSGFLLLTILICLPFTDTVPSSMTLRHTDFSIRNFPHTRLPFEEYIWSESFPSLSIFILLCMDQWTPATEAVLIQSDVTCGFICFIVHGSLPSMYAIWGRSALNVSIEGAQSGVVLEQVRCLLHTTCNQTHTLNNHAVVNLR